MTARRRPEPVVRLLPLGRCIPVVLRAHLTGCPACGRRLDPPPGREFYCEPCGVFRCVCCHLWRLFDDGGGDDPACNACWYRGWKYRRRALRRLRAQLLDNRARRAIDKRLRVASDSA